MEIKKEIVFKIVRVEILFEPANTIRFYSAEGMLVCECPLTDDMKDYLVKLLEGK
ncbi:MAG: hypothetical protein N2234_00225 [Planctomycetota bacterium]|nr:hypothetical protein [Planctomycetota bacterium]